MLRRRTWLYALGAIGIGAGATFLFAPRLRPDERVTGLPSSKRLRYVPLPENAAVPAGYRYFMVGPVRLVVYLDGKPVPTADLTASRALSVEFQTIWATRRKTLPAGADKTNVDVWSKELYWLPAWMTVIAPGSLTDNDLKVAVNGSPLDEFGRLLKGHYGDQDFSIWGQTLGGLMKNPLFSYVVIAAALATPGGAAVYGAYTLWKQRGELSAKNIAYSAARAYVVGQCGPACGMAFDLGLGVAQGKSVQKSAQDTLVKNLTPEQKKSFDDAKRLYAKAGG